jgi:hypothetical protein
MNEFMAIMRDPIDVVTLGDAQTESGSIVHLSILNEETESGNYYQRPDSHINL